MKSDIKKIEATCNLCGSNKSEVVTQGQEHEYATTTGDIFTMVKCSNCGLVYLNPRPDVSELDTIYPPDYYAYNQQKLKEQANPNSLLHKLRYAGFMAKISKSLKMCPESKIVTVLDIGCGDGHTLNLYRQATHLPVETHGVDFNSRAIEEAASQGHKTYCGQFEEVELPLDYFDLVTASHVIEHVADPKAFAQKVHSILKPGGIFWFETPNVGSLDARVFRSRHWGGYHFPRHWVLFDPLSIKNLARLTGFDLLMIDYYPNAIFWFWTFHSMIVRANPEWRGLADYLFPAIDFQRDTLANFLRICFFCGVDVMIKLITGQTSNMAVALSKPATVPAGSDSAPQVMVG